MAHVTMGEYARAAEDADCALRLDPSLAAARFIRGTAYANLGKLDDALADLDRALLLKLENARAYNQRGLIHAAQGRYDDAISDYTEALRLDRDCEPALFNRGTTHRLQGNCDQAIADFSAFIERKPQHTQAWYHRGLAYQGKETYDEAIADFNHAFGLDRSLHQAYESCLEGMRAKYEQQIAQAASATALQSTPSQTGALQVCPTEPAVLPELDGLQIRPTEPTRIEKNTQEIEATQSAVLPPPRAPRPSEVKLRLECPECGTTGLFDVRNLNRKFRCPGCSRWWRTDAAGVLVPAQAGSESNVAAAPASRPRMPSAPASATVTAAKTAEKTVPVDEFWGPPPGELPVPSPAKSSRPARKKKAAPAKVEREGQLETARLWLGAVAKTQMGRWSLAGTAIMLLVLFGGAVLSLFPSELRSRGKQKVALMMPPLWALGVFGSLRRGLSKLFGRGKTACPAEYPAGPPGADHQRA
jgi:Tfp pilus assembly protein PilF